MASLQPGVTVQIPVEGESGCEAIVLFVSKRERNVILLGIPSDALESPVELASVIKNIRALVYASRASIDDGTWPITRLLDMGPHTNELSSRKDFDSVWCGDERLRAPTAQDEKDLPVMLVAGDGALEGFIKDIRNNDLAKMTQRIVNGTKALFAHLAKKYSL